MRCSRLAAAIGMCCSAVALAQPLTTAFTFQGELTSAGLPAQGLHDFRFNLFDAAVGGTQIGTTLCADNVAVVDGRFIVSLDFGAVFTGAQRFLAIHVRADTGQSCAVIVGYTPLAGRQALTATPNAAFSLVSGNATQLNGQPGTFYTNASNITAGTLPDSRLSTNVAQLSLGGTYTGIPNFNGGTSGISSPFQVDSTTRVNNLNADLLDGLDSGAFALSGHTHDAGAIVSGTLADARLSSNIPRLNSPNTFSASNRFNAFTGVNRSTQVSSSEVFGLQNPVGGTGYTGMYINSTDSAGGQPFYGYSVNSLTAWTSLDTNGLWRLHNNGDRLTVARATGHVGIGTTTPAERLDISGTDTMIRVRNTNDPGGAFLLDSWGTLQLGLFNPSGDAWGQIPAGGRRSLLGVENTGRVGTLSNTGGAPVWRNILDDGAGNATFTGRISATNLPAIKESRTIRDARSQAGWTVVNGTFAIFDSVTVNVPAPGYLLIEGEAQLSLRMDSPGTQSQNVYVKIEETTAGSIQLLEENDSAVNSILTGATSIFYPIARPSIVIPTNSGSRTFRVVVTDDAAGVDPARVGTTAIRVTYFPAGL